MSKELRVIEITGEEKLPFQFMHERYGRAEFEICAKFHRGKVSEVWVIPRQQDVDYIYQYKPPTPFSTAISYSGYDGLDYPNVWYQYWCKEHKTMCVRLYVPNDAKFLWIHPLSTLTIGFTIT